MKEPARVDEPASTPPQVVTLHKASAAPAAEQEESLYEVRKKIYVRAVTGMFATWRWALVWLTQLLYYGLPWLPWNDRQAVLFDLVHRKFYILGLVFWPQDVFYLAVLLIISAYALFLFTAVAGRLWCGYACPQTVYTEIFMWIEQRIEGDRNKRMKLDAQPMNAEKFLRKAGKYGAWGFLALWTGFTFVGYFTPIRELGGEVLGWSLGPWETFWILFYGAFTYAFAGHMREQVCKYMCPYARFQGVMFDADTLVITYDTERGEPRGARRKGADPRTLGKGDCVDCGICVQVCPTGIDIRNGLQYECIGCAACIDACDQVMDKMSYPRGLIRYSTENAVAKHWGRKDILAHLLRPRTVIYSSILTAIVIAASWSLATRVPLKANFIRDRGVLAREVEGGVVENVFRLQLMNTAEVPRTFVLSVTGLDGVSIASTKEFAVEPATTQIDTLRVQAPPESGKRGSNPIYFEVRATDDPGVFVREKAAFLQP
jgi:cytochrome c oxidase accessory protein FixG